MTSCPNLQEKKKMVENNECKLRSQCMAEAIQLFSKLFNPPDVFPLTSIVNKSFNIEWCVNNMLQIIQNMMVYVVLELDLSMFRRTTMSGQH